MKEKKRFSKSILVMLVVSILLLAVLTPVISSKSNIESINTENKTKKNRIGFVKLLNSYPVEYLIVIFIQFVMELKKILQ